MTMAIAALVMGLVALVWSADRFVLGASVTARRLGVSPIVIGLTIVGFGTSAPELLVSAIAALEDRLGIAVGNAIGSNITNIALVLGTAAVITPLAVHSKLLSRELPILVLVMFGAGALLIDGELSRGDGLALVAGLAMMIWWLVSLGLEERSGSVNGDPLGSAVELEIPGDMSLARALSWVGIGLALLLASSRLLVWGAVELAGLLGISDLVIGLTVVAVGTSLPELAATVASALRKEHDIAIGNVIGSNMFNILGVLGIPALIAPGVLDADVLARDYPVMICLTLALFVMAYSFRGRARRINRYEGGALLTGFSVYIWVLYAGS